MAKKADSTYVNYMRYHLENLNNKTIGFDFFIEPILQSTDEELSSTQLRDIFTRFFKHLLELNLIPNALCVVLNFCHMKAIINTTYLVKDTQNHVNSLQISIISTHHVMIT